ncbi:MAG: helix-turn-helix domain-containing protein [Oscillospiraceae bacterium]
MSECTIKSGRKAGFTVIYNSMLKDNRISLRAKGLFAIMVSLPDDWSYTVSGLASHVGVSKDVVRASFRELESVGYLIREQSHGNRGKFGGNVYTWQDEAPPLSGNTDNGENRQRIKPSSDFATLQSKDLTKERKNKAPIAPAEVLDSAKEYAAEDKELLDAILGLLDNRAKLDKPKPVKTVRAMHGILRDLDEHSHGDRALKLRLLAKATLSNWLTVYRWDADDVPHGGGEGGRFADDPEVM